MSQRGKEKDIQVNRQADRLFAKIIKSRSGYLKTYKSIKNQKSKILTKPILCSIYKEESKNDIYSVNILY